MAGVRSRVLSCASCFCARSCFLRWQFRAFWRSRFCALRSQLSFSPDLSPPLTPLSFAISLSKTQTLTDFLNSLLLLHVCLAFEEAASLPLAIQTAMEGFKTAVEVLQSYEGKSFTPDDTQFAKLFHVNLKAKPKDDDDDEKVFFAEVVVFVFRFTPLLCSVNACLPVDNDGSGNSCQCLFPDCGLKHPSRKAYDDENGSPTVGVVQLTQSPWKEDQSQNKRQKPAQNQNQKQGDNEIYT